MSVLFSVEERELCQLADEADSLEGDRDNLADEADDVFGIIAAVGVVDDAGALIG